MDRPHGVLLGESFAVVSARLGGAWALATLAVVDTAVEDVGMGENGALVILHRDDDGDWQAAIEGTAAFALLVVLVPSDLIDSNGKLALINSGVPGPALVSIKFPWDSGQQWTLTRGWHRANYVDFAPDFGEPNKWALAAHGGTVTRSCNGQVTANLQIVNADGTITNYAHLDKNTVPDPILGASVAQGQELGSVYQGTYNPGPCGDTCSSGPWTCTYRDNCGCGTGPHVHFGLPAQDVTVDGWTSHPDNTWTKDDQLKSVLSKFPSSNVRLGPCPSSGGVILYKHADYDCGGGGEGTGWVRRDGAGWQAVPGGFNDQASSVKVPSGWSVKLYEHSDPNNRGGWACRTGDDDTFWGDLFDNGVGLNDNVSSFEVVTSPNCGANHPPNAPDLSSPPHGYVTHDSLVPILCWNNNGDPDIDPVEFHVEVRGAANADSPWIGNTCWSPSSLDGQYDTYTWRVEARDGRGATTWSNQTWHFAIQPPKDPPTISFDTANGSSFASGRIETRDRNWTFAGTAGDPEGRLGRIELRCGSPCDNTGAGPGETYGSPWSLERSDMEGRNDIYFLAYDDRGQNTASRRLDLVIDLAAPTTGHNLAGTMGENGWYVSAVDVHLHAGDGCTGNACVGVQEIYYRVDGGAWQTAGGDDEAFTVSGDGNHTVRYYAIDRVGNQEGEQQATFKIDATPPTAPGAATEAHGVVSEQWQTNYNDPAFTWVPATDGVSGLWYYRVTWADTLHVTTDPAYDPPQVGAGSYDLSVQALDAAGNIGPAGAQFTFRYDGTPPHAPEIENNDGVPCGVWQNAVRTADFDWPVPYDEGSGIAGYNVYWGPDPDGSSDVLTPNNSFVDPNPICAEDEAAIWYLRARSKDNVGWNPEWVAYALAYDGAPPLAGLVANYGLPVADQTSIHLDVIGQDEGSGVSRMRLSNDARDWTDWLDYVQETYWQIPAIGRRAHPIYLQLADFAGNVSEVVSDTVYLDVNPPDARSDNLWLWDENMPAGGALSDSGNYTLRTSVGQSLESSILTGVGHTLYGGYQAVALRSTAIAEAEPALTPTYSTHLQLGYVIAGGGTGSDAVQSTASGMASADYEMHGTLGRPADMRTIAGAGYLLLTGFWGGTGTDPPPPEEPPPPGEDPPPACLFYDLLINDGAPVTNLPQLTLDLCGPDPVEMMLSNDAGFPGAVWQPYATPVTWTLDVGGSNVEVKTVYARFRDGAGAVYGTFSDDIRYDPNAPVTGAAFDPAEFLPGRGEGTEAQLLQVIHAPTADLFLSALDDHSGLAKMQISFTPGFSGTEWIPYQASAPVEFPADGEYSVYVRVKDRATNVSGSASASVLVDTTPPLGGGNVMEGVVGPNARSVTVALAADDEGTGVAEVRIGKLDTFAGALWQPFASQVVVPVTFDGNTEPELHIQFRDGAGNESEPYTAGYLVDIEPPVLGVEVPPGDTLQRTVTVLAYDRLTGLDQMWLSNDPHLLDGVVTMPYTQTVTWMFDERLVAWVQLSDGVGNRSEPVPAAAEGVTMGTNVYLPIISRNH